MKEVEFKVIDLGIKEPETTIGIQAILAAQSLSELKSTCRDILKNERDAKFDYKEQIEGQLESQDWAQAHPMTTHQEVTFILKVNKVLESKKRKVMVDDDVADYICDAAADIKYRPTTKTKMLEAIAGFKETFEELKKSKGEPMAKDEKPKKRGEEVEA